MAEERHERERQRVRRVIKRDGSEVAFDVRKIRSAIQAALEAAGEPDPDFASEVASVVELALENVEGVDSAPTIETIQDMVERALMELGRTNVAKTYILYRDRRARVREALRVHKDGRGRGGPRVRESEGVTPWSKGRIVAALMEEAQLSRTLASEVASAVERRVFGSGIRRLTTGLIRELVTAELFERGQGDALSRSRSIGLPRTDLEATFAGRPATAWSFAPPDSDAAELAGRALVARYALEEVLPDGVCELHHSGDLALEEPGACDRPTSLSFEAELFAPGAGSRAAFTLLDRLAELSRVVSHSLSIERPGAVLAALTRQARPGSPLGLAAWLTSASAVARAAGIEIVLGSSGSRYYSFTGRLLEEWMDVGPLHGMGLVLDSHELEELVSGASHLAGVVDRMLADGVLRVSWGDGGEHYAGPGCRRMDKERAVLACGGAFALNLPRLARRAGPWREDIVLAGLADLVQAALEGARTLEPLQRKTLADRGLRPRLSFAIVPVGLREALFHLGDGEIDADQGARLLGLLGEAARRFAPDGASVVAPATSFGRVSGERFATLDQRQIQRAGVRQESLFADPALHAEPRPYSSDLCLRGSGTPAGRMEAEALRTLRSGALSFSALSRAEPGATPALDVWRRFEVLRRSYTGEVALELFPVPPSNLPKPSPLRPVTP